MYKKNSNYKESYISLLTNIGKPTASQIISFSWRALDRFQSRSEAFESKNSQNIGLITMVGGILVLGLPFTKIKDQITDHLLIISVVALLDSAISSLLYLRVPITKEPPTIGSVIEWLRKKKRQNLELLLISSLVIDLANAEDSHLRACKTKARYLIMAQTLQGIGVVFLFIYFILSKR